MTMTLILITMKIMILTISDYDCDNDNDNININTHEASVYQADKPILQGGPEELVFPPDNIGCSSPVTNDMIVFDT